MELDIDLISVPLLWKIHGLIMKYAPEIQDTIKKSLQDRESPRAVAKPAPKKKNKPMSSADQERNIKALQDKLGDYSRASSGSHSQEPVMPSRSSKEN